MGWTPTQNTIAGVLQALDQLAPLTAVKEHLPGNIIDILECLGKADTIPFNQLYSLVEDCADRYYTKVIQTLTCLMKNSSHDRQLVLVNTARALKFLETYAACQTKLWKVLSKYHNLPDHFHDLKTTFQAEFDFLKTATSKNIQNIQEALQSQQAYTTVLSGQKKPLYTKLVHLDRQIQINCIYPHPQSDIIQLNTSDYDPDIDGEPDPVTDVQPLNAKSGKEDTSTGAPKSEDHTAIPLIANRPEHQSSEAVPDIDSNDHINVKHNMQNIPAITAPNLKTSQN